MNAIDIENKPLAQVIICKCGASFAACVEPYCYTEKDWLKDLRKYVSEGCKVEMRKTGEWSFERCICKDEPIKDPNQLELF